ncbi:MAG: sulfatase/phosphatase domain-containing protein, partial [Opitutaceae bacterium]
ITGTTIPAGTTTRGRDISPVLRGTAKTWDNDFYAEYSMRHGATVHMRMIRTPEWKLMRDFNSQGRDELYQLAVDPDEARNLIADASPATQKILAQLDARILAKMAELKDPALPLARARQR